MRKKLLGYSLVSFFSFWFFLALFITGVDAQIPGIQPSIQPAPSESPQPSSVVPQTTDQTTIDPQPTVYMVPGDTSQNPASTTTYEPDIMPQPTIYLIQLDTPAARLVPLPTLAIAADLDVLFTNYSEEYRVDKGELEKIARCESNFHTQSVNGIYVGMFQFAGSTWIHARTAMGMDPNPDLRTNAEESIRTAAYWIAAGHLAAWSCR